MENLYVKKLYNSNIYDIKNGTENIHLIVLSAAGFFLPFILGHPQILVGTVVNAMLIIGATYLKGHKMLPLILLPGLGVLAAGILFGTYTPFLLYMLPFIWMSNALYVYVYKHFNINSRTLKDNISGAGAASVLKVALLFAAAFVMVRMSLLPPVFLKAMGLFQLSTAVSGAALAIVIVKSREKIVL